MQYSVSRPQAACTEQMLPVPRRVFADASSGGPALCFGPRAAGEFAGWLALRLLLVLAPALAPRTGTGSACCTGLAAWPWLTCWSLLPRRPFSAPSPRALLVGCPRSRATHAVYASLAMLVKRTRGDCVTGGGGAGLRRTCAGHTQSCCQERRARQCGPVRMPRPIARDCQRLFGLLWAQRLRTQATLSRQHR